MLLFPLPPPAMWPKNFLCLAVIGFPCIFLSCRTFRALARVGNDFFLPAIGPAYLTLGALRTGALRTGTGLRLGAIGAARLTPGVPALGDGLRLGVARLMGLGTRLRCAMIRLLYHPTRYRPSRLAVASSHRKASHISRVRDGYYPPNLHIPYRLHHGP